MEELLVNLAEETQLGGHVQLKLEMIFPPSFFNVMEQLLVHLAEETQLGGHVQYRWMYPFEK